jgi:hypothetical protein
LPLWWIKFYVRGIPQRESSHATDLDVAKKLLKRRLAEVEAKTCVMRTNVKIDELISDLLAEYRRERRKTITDVKFALEEVPGAVLRTNEGGRYHRHDASATPRNEKKKVQRARQSTGELAVLKRAFNLGLTWTPPKVRTVPAMKMYKESTPRKGFLTDDQYTQLARKCNREGLWHL